MYLLWFVFFTVFQNFQTSPFRSWVWISLGVCLGLKRAFLQVEAKCIGCVKVSPDRASEKPLWRVPLWRFRVPTIFGTLGLPEPRRLAANLAEQPARLQTVGSALAPSNSFTVGASVGLSIWTAILKGVSPPARSPALALGSACFSKMNVIVLSLPNIFGRLTRNKKRGQQRKWIDVDLLKIFKNESKIQVCSFQKHFLSQGTLVIIEDQ